MNRWILSAYAAAPSVTGGELDAEAAFMGQVTGLPGVAGLELPFSGAIHPLDEEWFLAMAPRDLRYTVTTIPDTMARVENDPVYGLASTDEAGRLRAVERAASAAAAVHRINSALGRRAVEMVTLFSAPRVRGGGSSGGALAESLTNVSALDWDGARLAVEHADAPHRSGRPVVKGFLPISAELAALREANRRSRVRSGLVVNWGRSMIETRRLDGPIEHVWRARRAGLLAGVVVSGCASRDTEYGAAWDDAHIPPQAVAAQSLLTRRRCRAFLRAAGVGDGLLGVKVASRSGADVVERVGTVERSLEELLLNVSNPPEPAPSPTAGCPSPDSRRRCRRD